MTVPAKFRSAGRAFTLPTKSASNEKRIHLFSLLQAVSHNFGRFKTTFLKFAYIVIAGGCVTYFLLYMNGEVNHSERGPLVRALNAATEASAGLMYAIAGLIVIFGIVTVVFSFGKPHK